jgi:hypothetical protein
MQLSLLLIGAFALLIPTNDKVMIVRPFGV